MKRILQLTLTLLVIAIQPATAQLFEQAKKRAAAIGKPLMLEFHHDDCEHCAEFVHIADTSTSIQNALSSVIYLPLSVLTTEGDSLAEFYDVGHTYPVFIVMTSRAEEVKRWTGFSGDKLFAATLMAALKDLASIDQRLTRFGEKPTYQDAVALARYYSDISEHLKAVDYYRQAASLNPRSVPDFTYEIFSNTANAIWQEKLAFDSIYPAADTAISSPYKSPSNVALVGNFMSQLARKFNRFENLSKYLEAGMAATKGQPQEKLQQYYVLLEADYALHIEDDTEKALTIRKAGLGEGWENERDKAYTFAKWCLDRKINLEEAERITRRTLDQVFPGRFKAMVLNTLAEICAAQGNYKEAFRVIALAVRENPENDYYEEQFERFRQLMNEQE